MLFFIIVFLLTVDVVLFITLNYPHKQACPEPVADKTVSDGLFFPCDYGIEQLFDIKSVFEVIRFFLLQPPLKRLLKDQPV